MMKTLLIHTPENYTSVSSLTEKKAVQESMEKHETSYFETSVLTHARKRFMWLLLSQNMKTLFPQSLSWFPLFPC